MTGADGEPQTGEHSSVTAMDGQVDGFEQGAWRSEAAPSLARRRLP
jgi:hypothetical protein